MIKEIAFKGITNGASDYGSADGDAAIASEFSYKGGLRKIDLPADVVFQCEDPGFVPHLIHDLKEERKNVFGTSTIDDVTSIVAYDIDNAGTALVTFEVSAGEAVLDMVSIGTFVCVALTNEIKFFLWQERTSDYAVLNSLPPFVNLQFSYCMDIGYDAGNNKTFGYHLQSEEGDYDAFKLDTDNISASEMFKNEQVEFESAALNLMYGEWNREREMRLEEGKLIQPVLARYAVKLYSGDYVQISPPVLLFPKSVIYNGVQPSLGFGAQGVYAYLNKHTVDNNIMFRLAGTGTNRKGVCYTNYDAYSIYLKITHDAELDKWEGLVQSIDIFLSREISLYEISSNKLEISVDCTEEPGKDTRRYVSLKRSTDWENIADLSNFFFVKSLDFKDVVNGKYRFTSPLLEEASSDISKLKTYLTAETLPESSMANSVIMSKLIHTYNKRLLLSDYSLKASDIYPLEMMCPKAYYYIGPDTTKYTDVEDFKTGISNGSLIEETENNGNLKLLRVNLAFAATSNALSFTFNRLVPYRTVRCNDAENKGVHAVLLENRDLAVALRGHSEESLLPIFYSYYGNYAKAFYMYGYFSNNSNERFKIDMEEHGLMNLSYFFNPFFDYNNVRLQGLTAPNGLVAGYYYMATKRIGADDYATSEDVPEETENKIISSESSVLKASNVNSPFTFKDGNIAVCGNGEIVGVCNEALPASTGQFGQYPIAVFTTEGVYSVSVNTEGALESSVPRAFGKYRGGDAVIPTDIGIVSISDSGIELIAGASEVTLLSTNMGEEFDVNNLPNSNEVFALADVSGVDIKPLSEYLEKAHLSYDFKNQRLLVFNPEESYSYIFDAINKLWFTSFISFKGVVKGSMSCLRQHDNGIVDLSARGELQDRKALFISRPLKLDAPDVLKTIRNVVVRGMFRKGHVKTVLWGSRNLTDWVLVASSQTHEIRRISGTPYKYFRLALVCNLEADESIAGASIDFVPKLTNRLR